MKRKAYEMVKNISQLIYKKPKIYLPDNYDESIPSIFMCNHSKNYGPVMVAAHFPYKLRPWSHSEVVHYDESFEYIRDTFCIDRLKLNKKMGEILAKLIAKPVVALVNMNNPIAIYHDGVRDIGTIRESIDSLAKNENQLIFATNDEPLAIKGAINPKFDFLQGYLLVVGQLLHKGITPRIYPVSINKEEATISIGEPIIPDRHNGWKSERNRIHTYIVNEVKNGYSNPCRDKEAVGMEGSAVQLKIAR